MILSEYYVESSSGQKPLMLLYFVLHLRFRQILCFTNSVETTHRLYLLMKLAGDIKVREISSRMPAYHRSRFLKQFAAGKVQMLVCTDSMARGMDVDNVKYIVSYDSPKTLNIYIHRVGRTARAGHVGTAITLLEKKEIFHFKKSMKAASKTSVKELKFTNSQLKPFVPAYQTALREIPSILEDEKEKLA